MNLSNEIIKHDIKYKTIKLNYVQLGLFKFFILAILLRV